jgi:hypothetical protein
MRELGQEVELPFEGTLAFFGAPSAALSMRFNATDDLPLVMGAMRLPSRLCREVPRSVTSTDESAFLDGGGDPALEATATSGIRTSVSPRG